MRRRRVSGQVLVAVLLAGTATAACNSRAAATSREPTDIRPIVSVKELMENVIDPQADFVFDAVGVDIGTEGMTETKPTTDDDWVKVQRGAVILAEATNLLKMPRRIAPPGDTNNSGGANAPELSPEQIQAKVDADRALWNSHADKLRDEALKVLDIVRKKDADSLFKAGSDIDQACESCHLDYWYPGDRAAVLKDQNSRAFVQKAPR
jgi:cytochrome c556